MTAFSPGDPVRVSFDGVCVAAWTPDGAVKVVGGRVSAWVRPEHLSPVPTPVLFADIRKGDRIRAVGNGETHEFTVRQKHSGALWGVGFVCNDSVWQFFRLTPPVPPEQEYEVGAVYQDADGLIYRRRVDEWVDFNGELWGHTDPARPLVRLVPEEPK